MYIKQGLWFSGRMFATGLAHTRLSFKSPTKRRGQESFLSTVLPKLGSYKSEMVQRALTGHSRGKHSCGNREIIWQQLVAIIRLPFGLSYGESLRLNNALSHFQLDWPSISLFFTVRIYKTYPNLNVISVITFKQGYHYLRGSQAISTKAFIRAGLHFNVTF